MQSEGGRIEVGAVIAETFSIYRSNAAVLLGSAAAVFIVVGILQAAFYSAGGLLLITLGSIAGLIGTTLYTGFVVKLVEDVRDGRRDFTVGELFNSAAGSVVSLIVNGFLKAIAVVIGLLVLIAPGLYLLTIWAVTAPVIVIERRGGIAAFGRSAELVRGRGWDVFFVIAVAFLIGIVISAIFGAIGAPLGDGGRIALGTIGSIVAAPIAAIVASVIYFQLVEGDASAQPAVPEPAQL